MKGSTKAAYRRVLIVDDDPGVRDVMAETVREQFPDAKISQRSELVEANADLLLVDVSAIGSIHQPDEALGPLLRWSRHRPGCDVIIVSGLPEETLRWIANEVKLRRTNHMDVSQLGHDAPERLTKAMQRLQRRKLKVGR